MRKENLPDATDFGEEGVSQLKVNQIGYSPLQAESNSNRTPF